MAEVKFKRKSTSEIENLPVEDGSFIVDYETGKTYMDYGNDRISTGGGSSSGGDSIPTGTEVEYTGSTVPEGWEQIDDVPVYSTTEHIVGTWIDGKPLYSKTFTGYSATGNYSHNIANVDHITIDSNGTFIKKTTGRTFPGNYYADGTADFASISANPQYIYITGTIANLSTITVTLIYTKTTD